MFANVYAGKKVLVTGHTGFKGSWMVEWLLDMGAQVAGYSVDIPSNPSLFEVLGQEKRIRHHFGDIRDLAKMERVFAEFQPDILFHMAAQPLVRLSYDEPRATFETNVMGTVNVLECVRKTPSIQAAVFIATDKCYENVEWEWGYRENDPLGGKDPYSASKAGAEIAFHSYYRSFFKDQKPVRMASVRAGNVIGGGDWAKDRIVPDCMRAWSRGEAPMIRNPQSTRPWQFVLEPLSGYLWLGARLFQGDEHAKAELNGESFNFGPHARITQPVATLIEEMQKTWSSCTWRKDPAGSGLMKEANLLKLNCDKAYNRLSWEASLGFEETVRMTTEWYKAYYNKEPGLPALTTRQIREYARLARERGQAWGRESK